MSVYSCCTEKPAEKRKNPAQPVNGCAGSPSLHRFPAEKRGGELCKAQAVLRLAGAAVFALNQHEHAADVALTENRERGVRGAEPAVCGEHGILAGGDERLFFAHQLLELLGDRLVHKLLFRDAGGRHDAVAVGNGDAGAAHGGDALGHALCAFAHLADRGILAEDDAAVLIDEDLERRALADLHGAPDFLRDDDPPEII